MGATYKMPAGIYYLGDPCYVIPSERWMEWLEKADYANPDNREMLVADLDGHLVLAFSTLYGDGTYPGSYGKSYPVDAGLIGLVPIGLPGTSESFRKDLTQIYHWGEDFECSRDDNGTLVFGHVAIVTGDDGMGEEEDEFHTIL